MYSKLFYFFLLIGLISQTIAAPNPENGFTKPMVPDENVMSSSIDSTEEITNSADNIKTGGTVDEFSAIFIERCNKHDILYIFDKEVLEKQIQEFSDADDGLPLNDITQRIETILSDMFDRLDNTDDNEATIYQATKDLTSVILSGKKSDLREIIQKLPEIYKTLRGKSRNYDMNITELLEIMHIKIAISTMFKEDPPLSTYLLDFLLNATNFIDRYQYSYSFEDMVYNLASSFEKLEKHIKDDIRSSNDTKNNLIQLIHDFSDAITTPDRSISSNDRFPVIRCMMIEFVETIFLHIFKDRFLRK